MVPDLLAGKDRAQDYVEKFKATQTNPESVDGLAQWLISPKKKDEVPERNREMVHSLHQERSCSSYFPC